jgi:creatinine amidohydrolase
MRPDELTEAFRTMPVAFVPWGALEWHSAHLPVGLDGLVAEAIAARAAEEIGGIVLPTFYLPITALPHRFSISLRSTTVRAVLDDLLDELARVGFRVVALLSGHYAQAHELVMIEAAEAAIERHGMLVLATPPLAMHPESARGRSGGTRLDHAGRWETSALLATHPELVDMRQLQRAMQEFPAGHLADLGILGEHPLATATAAEGEVSIEEAVGAIKRLIAMLVATGDPSALHGHYEQRREAYRTFLARYYSGSWEEAAARWWQEMVDAS